MLIETWPFDIFSATAMKDFRNKFQGNITIFTEMRAKRLRGGGGSISIDPPALNRVKLNEIIRTVLGYFLFTFQNVASKLIIMSFVFELQMIWVSQKVAICSVWTVCPCLSIAFFL